jgi:predicted GNAT family acetyltransferase
LPESVRPGREHNLAEVGMLSASHLRDPRAFLDRAGAKLGAEEVRYGLILGVSGRLVGDLHEYGTEDPWFLLLEEDGDAVALALRTPPYDILLAGFSGMPEETAGRLSEEASRAFEHLPGVVAEPEIADSFARAWCRAHGVAIGFTMRQRVCSLTEVRPVPLSPGHFRQAGERDRDLVTAWATGFQEDTFGHAEGVRVADRVARQLARGEIYLWEDGGPVSMASRARPTSNAVTIGMVYTPPRFRKRGYASSCVAALCELLLESGFKYCTLYTDLSNPTSNKIYKRIGFSEVCDSVGHTFTRPAP